MLSSSKSPERVRYEGSLLDAPTIRLAHVVGCGQADRALVKDCGKPALLCSFFYLKPWLKVYKTFRYSNWALDSGAFSAMNSGAQIDLDEYIETCQMLKKTDPTLVEIFALDVIGDWRATAKNVDKMWKAGVEAIPTFHPGAPWSELVRLAKTFPKIALGGLAKKRNNYKTAFIGHCFKRVWPAKIHGFAVAGESLVLGFPFHSVDSTSWELGPCGFGSWKSFGRMSWRGSAQNLRTEIDWYLRLQEKARSRWAREMRLLGGLPK
jgi:hypothetical protein